ncbi:Pvc16 family protein [Amycolatopsis nigrescens]|uniref:Pvc16 family protein n=1 Tax=Amycolatopsis nigrescens TaxID=381445 RepID=UPI00035F5422|nr:Pvc16 family protein [Amycolatopsis nigrescens]
MINEVNEALCLLLGRELPPGAAVRLDPPKPTWQTETPSDAVDLFLFGLYRDADEDGVRRCRLSYLVTARAARVDDEHRLLDQALRTAMRTETVPKDCFGTGFADGGQPVRLDLAETGPGALWTNLGMPARAAFVLEVSVPVAE